MKASPAAGACLFCRLFHPEMLTCAWDMYLGFKGQHFLDEETEAWGSGLIFSPWAQDISSSSACPSLLNSWGHWKCQVQPLWKAAVCSCSQFICVRAHWGVSLTFSSPCSLHPIEVVGSTMAFPGNFSPPSSQNGKDWLTKDKKTVWNTNWPGLPDLQGTVLPNWLLIHVQDPSLMSSSVTSLRPSSSVF